MVLRNPLAVALITLVAGFSQARAQTVPDPIITDDQLDTEYRPLGIRMGAFQVRPSFGVGATYDDNIYARSGQNKKDDVAFNLSPQIGVKYDKGNWQLRSDADVNVVRYANVTQENYVTANVDGRLVWMRRANEQVTLTGGYDRNREDRGDPEATDPLRRTPRIIEVTSGGLEYRREGAQLLVDMKGLVQRYRATSKADEDRDFDAYSATGSLGLRVGGTAYATVTGFFVRRDFKLEGTPLIVDRDARTYGARAGLTFLGNGFLEGSASVGVFRFEPDDARLKGNTGVSMEASLSYHPRRRTTITLDAFRGDVATVRLGAQSRVDTRFTLTAQQRIHHNLAGSLRLSWRQARYGSSGEPLKLRYLGAQGELEYLISRNLETLLNLSYVRRTSNVPDRGYNRLQASVGLRVRL